MAGSHLGWFDIDVNANIQARLGGRVPPWRKLDSTVVHSTQWFELRRDAVIRPDGNGDTYMHVVSPGSVTVLAYDHRDRIMLTRQWIYTHASTQWRLPGGGIDRDDSSALAAAHRELAEETGLTAGNWELAGRVHEADSLSNHVDSIFFASDLANCAQRLRPGEADLEVRWVSFDRALQLAISGGLPHAGSAQAILLMALRRQWATRVESARPCSTTVRSVPHS